MFYAIERQTNFLGEAGEPHFLGKFKTISIFQANGRQPLFVCRQLKIPNLCF
jgi:hypothetical protein